MNKVTEPFLIKHGRFMDVFIEVKTLQKFEDCRVVVGEYWNLGFVKSFSLGYPAKLKIKDVDWKDWKTCQDLDPDCLRYVEWK